MEARKKISDISVSFLVLVMFEKFCEMKGEKIASLREKWKALFTDN